MSDNRIIPIQMQEIPTDTFISYNPTINKENKTELIPLSNSNEPENYNIDENNSTINNIYDSNGNLVQKEVYDASGNIYKIIKFHGGVIQEVEYFYDVDGNLFSKREINYDSNGNIIKIASYDANNNPYKERITYSYDINGNLSERVEYDTNSNLIREQEIYNYDDNGVLYLTNVYNYSANGNLVSEEKSYYSNGSIYEKSKYIYNINEELERVEEYDSNGNLSQTVKYNYDVNGNLIQKELHIINSNRIRIDKYNYDTNGDLIVHEVNLKGELYSKKETYDANDNLIQREIYDSNSNLSRIETYDSNGELIQNENYTAELIENGTLRTVHLEDMDIYLDSVSEQKQDDIRKKCSINNDVAINSVATVYINNQELHFYWLGDVDYEIFISDVETYSKAFANFPENVQELISSHLDGYYIGKPEYRTRDIFEKNAPKDYSAFYNSASNYIYINGEWLATYIAANHEMGHAIDDFLGPPILSNLFFGGPSSSVELNNLYKEYKITIQALPEVGYQSIYFPEGMPNSCEFFAEAITQYINNPEELQTLIPELYDYVDELFSNI